MSHKKIIPQADGPLPYGLCWGPQHSIGTARDYIHRTKERERERASERARNLETDNVRERKRENEREG